MRKFLTLFTFSVFLGLSGYAQYCIPYDGGNGCSDGDDINDFILFGENGTALNTPGTGCDPSGMAYEDYTLLAPVDLSQTVTYFATVSTDYTGTGDNLAIWIDFNDDEIFDNTTELVGTFYSMTQNGDPVQIDIPLTATLGLHRMRATQQYNVDPFFMDACNTWGDASFTETHDYMVNIVGPPTCPSVTGLTLTSVSDVTASISWTGTGAPLYSIEVGPAGFTQGTGTYGTTATTSFTINGLDASTSYTAYVRAICDPTDSSSLQAINFATTCALVDPPYIQPFDSEIPFSTPECMTIEDGNGDDSYWQTDDWQSFSNPLSLIYYATYWINADDWIFTPGINMEANYTYQITFKYKTGMYSNESLEVLSGSAPSSTSMDPTILYSNSSMLSDQYTTVSFPLTPTTTGPQYVGFHVLSDAYADFLSIEDINIEKICGSAENLAVSNITTQGADLTWSPVFDVAGYEYVLNQTSGNPTVTGIATTATAYTTTGLAPGATYYFHLRTHCSDGGYSQWQTISFTTASTTCGLPTAVAATGITPYTANLNWNAITGAISYDYKLDQTLAPPSSGWVATSVNTYSASGLQPNTTYYFHVRTHCLYGNSGWVTEDFTTGDVTCATTTNLAASNITPTSTDVIWTLVPGAVGYEYVLDQTTGNPSGNGTQTTQNIVSVNSLTPNATYYFHLRTDCGGGEFSDWMEEMFSTAPLGVENVGNDAKLAVYPNPTTNAITVEASQASAAAQVQLMDISGRILQTMQLDGGKAEIEMAELATGMYLLKFTDNGNNQLIKVMKQ